ncbi:MAG: NADP-dependent oxidoreductase [Pseudomonadota bacterium]
MTNVQNQIVLASRPEGWVTPDNFRAQDAPIPEPGTGQLLLEHLYLSVDPYMRGRMNATKSYVPPFEIDAPIMGGGVARVVATHHPRFQVGDIVVGMLSWQEFSLSDGADLRKVERGAAPLSYHLGILGMPGQTAYVGLMEVAKLRPGETVFISAAAGAVGSVAGQIARQLGCYVVGSAGSDDKVTLLTEAFGYDAGFNYKTVGAPHEALAKHFPRGIDVVFENVGGPVFEAAIWNIALHGRIALCGMIADYNATRADMPAGPRGMTTLIGRNATLQGFIVSNYPAAARKWDVLCRRWLAEGKLNYQETVSEGLTSAPAAFIGMLKGENRGKQIVRIKPDEE